jgi:hypothetical protein
VLAEGQRRARMLLVGDCLYLDIITFAQPALTAEGITLDPTFLTSKNPIQLRREITALDPGEYCGRDAAQRPCHDFLPRNGFAREGDTCVFRGREVDADPPWLTIDAPAPPTRRAASAG